MCKMPDILRQLSVHKHFDNNVLKWHLYVPLFPSPAYLLSSYSITKMMYFSLAELFILPKVRLLLLPRIYINAF